MDYNKNYYQMLGVDKNASAEDIKKSYRKLAHQSHPDKNNGDDTKFKELNSAYSVLSSDKKQEYDTRSPHGNSYSPINNMFGGGSGFEFHFNGSDIFSQFFGKDSPFNQFGGGFRQEFRENLDVNVNVIINLKQIYLNENLKVKYKKHHHCDKCDGTGFDRDGDSYTCEICNGTGRDNFKTCEYCRGVGKIYSGQCKTCLGEKVILKETEITMQNVAQLRNNIRNAHRGYGHQSKCYREKVGNLILNIIVDRNDNYKITNNNELNKTINIHFEDAIKGSEIVDKHIDDTKIKIKLPEKTKNGDIIRIKNKGLLNNNVRSDLFLKINIIIDYERI